MNYNREFSTEEAETISSKGPYIEVNMIPSFSKNGSLKYIFFSKF